MNEVQLLNKGCSYIPKQISYKHILEIVQSLKVFLLNSHNCILYSASDNVSYDTCQNMLEECKNLNQQDKEELKNMIKSKDNQVGNIIFLVCHLIKCCKRETGQNSETDALRKLLNDESIIITKSDKGNCFVILDKEHYVKECLLQLSDKEY